MAIRHSTGIALAALSLAMTGIAAPASVVAQTTPATTSIAAASIVAKKTVCFNQKKHTSKVVTGSKCAGANWKPVANFAKKLNQVATAKKQSILCVRKLTGYTKVVAAKKCSKGYQRYTAAQLGIGPAAPIGPVSAPSSPILENWDDLGPGTAMIRIRNYDPALTYQFSAYPTGSFQPANVCTVNPENPAFRLGCFTVATSGYSQWVSVSVTASYQGATSTPSLINLQTGPELPGVLTITNVADLGPSSVVTVTPASTGGIATDYEYRVDGGRWLWAGDLEDNELTIVPALNSGEVIEVRGVNASGPGAASNAYTVP